MKSFEDFQLLDLADGDLEFIIAITKENMAPIIKDTWGLDWDKGFEERYLKGMLSSGVVKAVYCGDEPIGYCWFSERDDKNEVFINSIQLRRDYQRKGAGLRVLKWIENYARNRKIRYLGLVVQETNPRAAKIYQQYGFQEVLREGGSIGMQKELFY